MPFTHLNDLLSRFGDYPPERIRLRPRPGTATKQDVIEVGDREDRLCELIDGVLVEKATGFKESYLATCLAYFLSAFVRQHNLGVVLGAGGTVELFPNQVRIPDVAFYSWNRLPGRRVPTEPVPELVPDLAIEVLSKSNTPGEMFQKRKDYFLAGYKLAWFVDPGTRTVGVFTAPDRMTRLTEGDTLDGGDVLVGFQLAVAELFVEGDPSTPASADS